jgi:hypothetical protein
VAVAVVARPGPLRAGAALYALLCLAALVLPTPVGGNATRLGALLAAPVAFALLWPRRPSGARAAAVPIAYWVAQPAVRDVRRAAATPRSSGPSTGHCSPSSRAAAASACASRSRSPRTTARRAGWRGGVALAAWVGAPARPRAQRALLRRRPLSPTRTGAGCAATPSAFVALPEGVPLDASAEEEKRLLLDGRLAADLTEVGRPGRWRVWRVEGTRPMASGAARLTRLRADGFVLRGRRAGTTTVRVRHTPYWELASGRGCIGPAPGGWTLVRAEQTGTGRGPDAIRAGARARDLPRCR